MKSLRLSALVLLCTFQLSMSINAQNVGIETTSPDSTLSIKNKLEIGGAQGDIVFTDDEGSITFPASTAPNSAMINMFSSGTSNADRMVISHSAAYQNWGLQYNDTDDDFYFLANGDKAFSIDLAGKRASLGSEASLNALFTLNVQSSTEDRTGYFLNSKAGSSSRFGMYAGAFGGGTGDQTGGAFDAVGSTGTNFGVKAFASGSATNIGVYVNAQGGTKNWAAHFDSGDVIVDDRVGIGTQTIASGVGLHVMSQDIRMEGNNDFFNIVSTSTTNLNGLRFYSGTTFQGALFYDSGDDLLNITGLATTPLLVSDFASSRVGIGTFAPSTKLQILGGADVSLTGLGYFQLGSTVGTNLVFDDNEIEARNNGAASVLYVQRDAGNLSLCGTNNGGVGIGTVFQFATGYALSVDGKIISEELRIQNSSNWPDYVFADEYELMPLDELEKAINSQKHLPNIPSADVVESEGLLVGDMQKRMMEKIEELTLYVIEINKQNQTLSKDVRDLKKELEAFKLN